MTARKRRAAGLRHIVVIGRGKVGSALARASRAARVRVTALGARELGPTSRVPRADLIIIAARDKQIELVAGVLARLPARLPPVVHCAGALGIEVLEPLRARGVAIAAAHPAAAFADVSRSPSLSGASLVISGDVEAVRQATLLARRIGMTPIVVGAIDRAAYHAAAALVANGAAALVALAADVLVAAGLDRAHAPSVLGPLLASVGANVKLLGPLRALSGPVRRGDAATVQRHLETLHGDAACLYGSLVQAQLPLARALGEAEPDQLDAVQQLLEEHTGRTRV